MTYPTTEEVLEATEKINVDWYIEMVKLWKTHFYKKQWSKSDDEYKFLALSILVQLISAISKNRDINYVYGVEYSYIPDLNLITLGKKPSIISTLHELGHAIIGHPEIDACAFSTAIYRKVFPTEYKKLEWKGHMLVRKQN